MKFEFPAYDAELVEQIETYLDQDYMTEVVSDSGNDDGLAHQTARGKYQYVKDFERGIEDRPGIKRPDNYSRPMFEIVGHHASVSVWQHKEAQGTGCGACYDFSRSWACPDHPDRPFGEWMGKPPDELRYLVDRYERIASAVISEHIISVVCGVGDA